MNKAEEPGKVSRSPQRDSGMFVRPQETGPKMAVVTETIPVQTEGGGQMIDLTSEIGRVLKKIGLSDGTVTVFVGGSTASITTIEFEPGLMKDFPDAMERFAPSSGIRYKHDDTWHDGNGHSHVRASIIGPSLTVPFAQGKLMIGTWQQIVVIDWDNRGRYRDIILQFMGIKG